MPDALGLAAVGVREMLGQGAVVAGPAADHVDVETLDDLARAVEDEAIGAQRSVEILLERQRRCLVAIGRGRHGGAAAEQTCACGDHGQRDGRDDGSIHGATFVSTWTGSVLQGSLTSVYCTTSIVPAANPASQ
ncbi:hypothetical protein GALL_357850 [mine drainage metagenome]|uniref:Uncharacterized protein n=1 Tax=mine drainage metagenome TaxID=410659 RepID=A0A1J5QYA2_9ZZZZ